MLAQKQLENLSGNKLPNPKRQRSDSAKFLFDIISGALIFLILLIVGIFLLETVFRLARIGEGESLEPSQTLGCIHMPGKMVTFRLEGYSHENLSSQRMRDVEHDIVKPAGVKRIAVLGDSTTEGLQVSMDETYARQLQNRLNANPIGYNKSDRFEVLNFGCASYSTGQERLLYQQQVRQFKPDTVVVLYNFGDSAENIFVPQSADHVTPRPYFHLEKGTEDSTSLYLVEDDSVLKMNTDVLQPNPIMDYIRRESRIFGVLSQQNLMLSINEPLYTKIKRVIGKIPFPGTVRHSTAIIHPAYDLPDAMQVTAKIFSELNSEVQKDGARLIVVTFPNMGADPTFEKEEAVLKETGRKQNFAVISLTKAFLQTANSPNLFLRYHFSKYGHGVVANVLSSFIEKQKP
ncbi:MAG: SGNH/GDSL hydrolase family protein [Candidatus Obscuribacterales bacterium]|nr:SGNH/GDSL hydrolase family protein [Candidatus Obscuribacterales bacterium]